jgi:NADPH2:quinone reductase
MRAAVFVGAGGPEVIRIADRPRPAPGPEQVLVRVRASALGRADVLQRLGLSIPPPDAPSDIPGLDVAGEIEEIGDRVARFRPGQRVFGLANGGAQAEFLALHEGLLVPIPANLDFYQAAAVPDAFITADDALFTQAELAAGEAVLIHAVGSGVGSAAVQLAHVAGHDTLGTARSPAKLARAAELGLGLGINATRQDFAAAIAQATDHRGVPVCIDFVGSPYLAGNLAALSPKGRLIVVGLLGGATATINLGLVLRKRLRIIGTALRGRPLAEKIAATQRFAERVVPLLETGAVRPIIDRVYRLDDVAEAHGVLEANANFGKIVIALD